MYIFEQGIASPLTMEIRTTVFGTFLPDKQAKAGVTDRLIWR